MPSSRLRSDRSAADRAEDRSRIARAAALTRWGRSDATVGTQAARDGFAQKWLHAADPEGVLPERERIARAERLRRAHFIALARKSAEARRARTLRSSLPHEVEP